MSVLMREREAAAQDVMGPVCGHEDTAIGADQRVLGDGRDSAVQLQQLVQIRDLAIEFSAEAKRRRCGRTSPQLGMRTEHRRDRIALLEPVLQEIADIAGIELRPAGGVLGPTHPVAPFPSGTRRSGNPEDPGGIRPLRRGDIRSRFGVVAPGGRG